MDQQTLDRPAPAQTASEVVRENTGPLAKALMGAAAGAVGTVVLDQTDWLLWNREGEASKARTNEVRPYGEPPAHVLAHKAEETLALEPTPEQHEIAGTGIHYGIGMAPAVLYALLRHRLPLRGVPRGLAYGLTLFAVQDEVLNSAGGLGAKPGQYPLMAHVRGLAAHLAYGVATELALDYMEKAVAARRLGAASGSDAQGAPRAEG